MKNKTLTKKKKIKQDSIYLYTSFNDFLNKDRQKIQFNSKGNVCMKARPIILFDKWFICFRITDIFP